MMACRIKRKLALQWLLGYSKNLDEDCCKGADVTIIVRIKVYTIIFVHLLTLRNFLYD